jgi:hypothetical protein
MSQSSSAPNALIFSFPLVSGNIRSGQDVAEGANLQIFAFVHWDNDLETLYFIAPFAMARHWFRVIG